MLWGWKVKLLNFSNKNSSPASLRCCANSKPLLCECWGQWLFPPYPNTSTDLNSRPILHTGNISVDRICGAGSLPKIPSSLDTEVSLILCLLQFKVIIAPLDEDNSDNLTLRIGLMLWSLDFFVITRCWSLKDNKDQILGSTESSSGCFSLPSSLTPRGAEAKSAGCLVISIACSRAGIFRCPPAGVCTLDILGQKWQKAACLDEVNKINPSMWSKINSQMTPRGFGLIKKITFHVKYLLNLTRLVQISMRQQLCQTSQCAPSSLIWVGVCFTMNLSVSTVGAWRQEMDFYWESLCHWKWWMPVFITEQRRKDFFGLLWMHNLIYYSVFLHHISFMQPDALIKSSFGCVTNGSLLWEHGSQI